MSETREQRVAEYKEKYKMFNTSVEGKPLHAWIEAWEEDGGEAAAVIDRFCDLGDDNCRLVREVESLVDQGSYFPGNHKDFHKLPGYLACTICPAFHGVVKREGSVMTVECEWPRGLQWVKMELNRRIEGGAKVLEGDCKASGDYGISPKY